jgi:hypothetical protein
VGGLGSLAAGDDGHRAGRERVAVNPRRRPAGAMLALAAVLAGSMVCGTQARAASAAWTPGAAPGERAWVARGGELRLRLNHDLLRQYGAGIERAPKADPHGAMSYDLRDDALAFTAAWGNIRGFGSGALTTRAGFVLRRDGRRVELPWLALEAGAAAPPTLVLRDPRGRAWFVAERMMYRLDEASGRLRMPTADLRAGPALAAFLGDAEAAGLVFGELSLDSRLLAAGPVPDLPKTCISPQWHGVGGRRTDVLLAGMSVQQLRCRRSTDRVQPFDLCDGPGGADDGEVVLAPSALLRNSDTDATADVPWYEKFMAGTPRPPYGNDQHPILVWNLYRIGGDGRIRQVGRSGAKHAWFSANTGCNDPTCGLLGGNILGRGCADEYTASSNDLDYYLAPRSEIVPARGLWGRCGSTWDRQVAGGLPGCDGEHDPWVPPPPAEQGYYERLVARESDLEAGADARWFFEAWYVVRDDIDIFNTMGRIEVEPRWTGFQWRLDARSAFASGPALDAWVAPGAGARERSDTLATPEGTLRIAARATPVGARWRYDYAIMNLDFARAVTAGAEPDLRVLDARGIGGLSIPLLPDSAVTALQAFDLDREPGNDWTARAGVDTVSFDAPASGNSIDWGTLHAFSFESAAAPREGTVTLVPARAGSPAAYAVPSLVPGVPPLFADGFE